MEEITIKKGFLKIEGNKLLIKDKARNEKINDISVSIFFLLWGLVRAYDSFDKMGFKFYSGLLLLLLGVSFLIFSLLKSTANEIELEDILNVRIRHNLLNQQLLIKLKSNKKRIVKFEKENELALKKALKSNELKIVD